MRLNLVRVAALPAVILLAALGSVSCSKLPAGEADTAALAGPPDLSGVWLPISKESGRWPGERPFTPAFLQARAKWDADTTPIDLTRDDSHTSCLPYTLPQMMTAITPYPFEIVMTPRRIYLLTETFGQVRRIDLSERGAGEVLPTRAGISHGRWKGSELVVETTNILPEKEGSRFPASAALRVSERMSLELDAEGNRKLVNVVTVVDPFVYQEPVTVRMVYRSAPNVQVGEYICEQDVWEQHLSGTSSLIPWRQ